MDLLLALADPKDPAFVVVLTMRRDYYNLCSEFPALYHRLEADDRRARYLVGRMRNEDLRRVVTEPLKLAGVPEGDREALVTSVLADMGEKYQGDLLQTYTLLGQEGGEIWVTITGDFCVTANT